MATVIVMDDQPEVRELLTTMVQQAGHHALPAADAAQAWGLLGPDTALIFADIDMPGETGVEFVLRLRQQTDYVELPVVFVTAYHERAAPLVANSRGRVKLIDKPFRLETILKTLETILGPT